MLQHCYQSFEKAKFASLTAKISQGASNGDAMCARILYDAGFALGRHIAALSRNIHEVMFIDVGYCFIVGHLFKLIKEKECSRLMKLATGYFDVEKVLQNHAVFFVLPKNKSKKIRKKNSYP